MDFLELSVFRPSAEGELHRRAVATVLCEGRDLFHSLERSVAELRKAGWAVDDVKAFHTNFMLERTVGRQQLRTLYRRALDSGIEWHVEESQVQVEAAVVA